MLFLTKLHSREGISRVVPVLGWLFRRIGAGHLILHEGVEIGAGRKSQDGEEPLEHPHEAPGLLQHVRVHDGCSNWLEMLKKIETV